jgi:PAS domain S-box-containing protein
LSSSKDSTNIKPKKENAKVNVKEDKILSPAFSSCDLALDKERLKDILENIPSAVVVLEKPDGNITYANKRAIELYGVDPCGVRLEKHAAALRIYTLDGKVCPTEELYTYRALFNEETVLNAPEVIERPDGKRFIVNVSAKPLYDKEDKANVAVAIFDDVTERVKTQEALKESEERLKMAQMIAHVGNWEYSVKEDRAIWSDELFRIFGLKPQHYGPNTTEYVARIHPQDREAINKTMEQMLFKGVASKASFDYRIIREDGSVRTIHSERMIREVDDDKKPKRMVGVEQDITERKQIEQKLEEHTKNLEKLVDERTKQLKDAERLATIGQTAGMIGHDIRNPLQAIVGELFLIKQDVDSSPDSQCKRNTQESLGTIQEQIDYINKIISDLQDYARPLKPELVEVDLCIAIPQLLSTVKVPNNIQAFARCDKRLRKLKLDLTFLKRILVNLAINAIQAMPNGGKLIFRAFEQDNQTIITVEDTGVGIPDEIKPKIFQPLMTTKSKGQGFGLAVVKRLVEAQGGTITFESKVGRGTQFKITFPKETKITHAS